MKTFGDVDERSRDQLQNCITAGEVSEGQSVLSVLCADHHPGYSQPIGGVVAYRKHISPTGVGYDIACGNAAARLNVLADDVEIPKVMDEIFSTLAFGVGRSNNERVEHEVLDAIAECHLKPQRNLAQMAAKQLGTVGSGNHYVDLFRDGAGYLWIGVHFGSRGFGHKTCTGFLSLAQGKRFTDHPSDGGMDSPPTLLDTSTALGADYLDGMHLAGAYAYAGRDWVLDRVQRIIMGRNLPADRTDYVHNHHNFAWREEHAGEHWWVIRKGATPAFPGQRGFVGGSMGDISVIIEGVDSDTSKAALYSTMHGAGRVMSRTEASGKVKRRKAWSCGQRDCDGELPIQTARGADGSNPRCPKCGSRTNKRQTQEVIREGKIDWPASQAAVKAKGVELRGAGADEAPLVYKKLPEVLAAHHGTIVVSHVLMPIGVAMAPAGTFDPYKD